VRHVILQRTLFFLYDFLWAVVAVLFLPYILLANNRGLFERAGLKLPLGRLNAETLWVHALSVGEVMSALPLVRALKKAYPHREIVFSATTRQGLKTAHEALQGEVKHVFRMPLDFWWSINRVIDYFTPGLFIVVETDLWPRLLFSLKKRGVKTILVNSRISPRTFRAYTRVRPLIRDMLLDHLDLCMMQSDLDRERLLHIGISPKKAVTVGNIKYDREWLPMAQEEHARLLGVLGLRDEDDVWVAGSTHQGEEEILMDVFLRLRSLFPKLRLVIAPRKIEQSEGIHHLAAAKDLKPVLRTAFAEHREPYDILILNTMGELGRIYGIGKIAFVGGSLIPMGGHNLIEPAVFGRPVLFGPYTHNFVLMSELLIEAGGGKRVNHAEELFEAMKDLLSHPERLDEMGRKARDFVERNTGALGRAMEHLGTFL
jgi:3-deoxy-D-manno-octulosonic-acid transferase